MEHLVHAREQVLHALVHHFTSIKCTRAQIARHEYARKPLYRLEARVQVLLALMLACFQSVSHSHAQCE